MRTSVRSSGPSGMSVTPPWFAPRRAGSTVRFTEEHTGEQHMVAVTITAVPGHRAGPTTRPHRPVTRAVYLRRRAIAGLLGMALVVAMAQAGAAIGGSTLAAPERRPATLVHTI